MDFEQFKSYAILCPGPDPDLMLNPRCVQDAVAVRLCVVCIVAFYRSQLVCQHACGHVSQLNWIARDMFKRSPNPYIISSLATPAMVAGCSAIDLEQIFSFPVYLSLIPVSAATSLAFWKPEKPLEVCWLWLLSVMLTLAYWSLSVTMAKRCITATRTVGSHRSTTSRRRGNNDNNNTSEVREVDLLYAIIRIRSNEAVF